MGGCNYPPPLTGGSGRRFHQSEIERVGPLGRPMRPRPDIQLSEPGDDYARLLAWGWDTIQEAYPYAPDGALVARLEKAKGEAREARDGGDGVSKLEIGGADFLCHATGAAGGVAYRIENDDLIFLIRSAACDWGVSVRYKAAGLWEHGWKTLREYVSDFLDSNFVCRLTDEPRISRADYAFDFYSPAFTGEFDAQRLRRLIVCHSSTKVQWLARIVGTSVQDQTLTIGCPNSLQLTVYDKATEIKEASGKTWMEELWARTCDGELLYYDAETNPDAKPRDVWRLEIRMGKGFLKERNAQPISQFDEYASELIGEALVKIRVSSLHGEKQVRNRPLHPLWSLALEHVNAGGKEMLPIGRRVTGKRDVLVQRAVASLAGGLRSALVLASKSFGPDERVEFLKRIDDVAANDPASDVKIERLLDRYEFVDDAN